MSTYALVRDDGGTRRYWRRGDDPAGSWEEERGMATRWSLPKQAHVQRARLLIVAEDTHRQRSGPSVGSVDSLLRTRVVRVTRKAKAPLVPILWTLTLGPTEVLRVGRALLGPYVALIEDTETKDQRVVGEAETLPDLLASLGRADPSMASGTVTP